jgi:threonine dehydrogenase-like Zn-dependent dehydrogenase
MRGLMVRAEWSPKTIYRPSKWEHRRRRSLRGNMVWKNPTWGIESVPDPSVGPHDVLVQIRACGVCGSDVSMLQVEEDNYIAYGSECSFPCVVGHELVGKIVEVGPSVDELKPGDVVYIEEKQWCGRCDHCRSGDLGQCVNREQMGFTVNGGYADYVAVEDRFCWNLESLYKAYNSEDEVVEAGVLLEPLGDVYQGIIVSAGGFLPGGHVVVFGAGPIGLAAMALARAIGAGEIIAFEPEEARRKLARSLGIEHVEDPFADPDVSPAEVIMELTDGAGAAMLIEAAGELPLDLPWMEQALAVRGKIVLLGIRPGYPRIDPLTYQILDGSLYGCLGHPGHGNTTHTLNLLAAKRVDLRPIITGQYELNDAVEAIHQAANRNEGKILVKPDSSRAEEKTESQSQLTLVK